MARADLLATARATALTALNNTSSNIAAAISALTTALNGDPSTTTVGNSAIIAAAAQFAGGANVQKGITVVAATDFINSFVPGNY